MKKNLRTIMAIVLAMVMCGSMSLGAAAESSVKTTDAGASTNSKEYTNGNVYPYAPGSYLSTSTTWKTVAYSTTGFNCNVYIRCMNTAVSGWGVVPCDIRMLGKNGQELWSENGAIPGLGSRIFVCGSDVYTIQIRTQSGVGSAYAYETTEDPT